MERKIIRALNNLLIVIIAGIMLQCVVTLIIFNTNSLSILILAETILQRCYFNYL